MKKGVGIGVGVFGGIFMAIGLLAGGIFIIVSVFMKAAVSKYEEELDAFKPCAEQVTGIVDESGDSYTLIVYYTLEG